MSDIAFFPQPLADEEPGAPRARGLSRLQRSILKHTAEMIRDRYEDQDDWPWEVIRVRSLMGPCFETGADQSEEEWLLRRQSLGRSIRRLIERRLLHGIGLAWCRVTSAEAVRWQGGGGVSPRILLVGLTEAGWKCVEGLNETNVTRIREEHDR